MYKYQEAINKIDDYCYGHSINDSHQNLENDFRLIQELIYKEEKYRWHDLRKNPDDLPKGREWVLAVFKEPDTDFVLVPRVSDYVGRPTGVTTKENWILMGIEDTISDYYANLVCIGWKYIEEFE